MAIHLADIPTRAPEGYEKHDTKKENLKLARKIADYQHMLYAEEKRAILIVFQGMDASGKDGATRKVFSFCSPAGVNAYAFKKPTDKEFGHDFLWRVHKQAPQKGMIQIFNRSHYEDILIQRVHKWISEEQVDRRIEAINAFEKLLIRDNNTTILKFYLHLSRERQKEKLQERIDDPRKNWKHNPADWKEAELWDDYRHCYEDAINRSDVPWIVVPADQRWYRDHFVAKKVLETLEEMDIILPVLKKEGI